MPNYNYKCNDCNHSFEIRASIEDMETGNFSCEKCGSKNVYRLFNGFRYFSNNSSKNINNSTCMSCHGKNCSNCK